jgi:hypothetical protein
MSTTRPTCPSAPYARTGSSFHLHIRSSSHPLSPAHCVPAIRVPICPHLPVHKSVSCSRFITPTPSAPSSLPTLPSRPNPPRCARSFLLAASSRASTATRTSWKSSDRRTSTPSGARWRTRRREEHAPGREEDFRCESHRPRGTAHAKKSLTAQKNKARSAVGMPALVDTPARLSRPPSPPLNSSARRAPVAEGRGEPYTQTILSLNPRGCARSCCSPA